MVLDSPLEMGNASKLHGEMLLVTGFVCDFAMEVQGTLRVNRFNYKEGWVASESVGEDILISGSVDMNRAFDGGFVFLVAVLINQRPRARILVMSLST